MTNPVLRIHTSTFMRHNAIFFVGSIAMGVLNYLYYPILGRLLDTVAFGEVQALVSLFLQVVVFLSVLGMVTVNIVANYADATLRNRVVLELEKLALWISLALLLLTIVLQPFLQDFLHFNSSWPFVILGLAIVATVPLTLRSSYLRGRHYFGLSSLAMIVGAGSKLLFSVVLVLMGFGTIGAILGIVLGQLLAVAYAGYYAKKYGFNESFTGSLTRFPDLKLIKPELSYGLLVLVGSLTITALYSIDTIVVKHFFDAHTAGLYAGIAAVARIVFFVTAPITQVLMAAVRLDQSGRKNSQILLKSFALIVVIGGLTHLSFWLFPHFIITHLMGATYASYAHLLPRLSLVVLVISVLSLFVTYYMALRTFAIAGVVIGGATITAVLMALHHDSLQAVINSLLYGSLSLAACLVVWKVGSTYRRFTIGGKADVS